MVACKERREGVEGLLRESLVAWGGRRGSGGGEKKISAAGGMNLYGWNFLSQGKIGPT